MKERRLHSSPSTSIGSESQMKSVGRKVTALGFITLTLTLNFWMIGYFSDSPHFLLLKIPLCLGVATAFIGGILILVDWIKRWSYDFFAQARPE